MRRAACTRSTRRPPKCSLAAYTSGAPEVEGLIRLAEAGLRVDEVPVNMRERAGGESKLAGRRALHLVVTVGAAIFLGTKALGYWRRLRD